MRIPRIFLDQELTKNKTYKLDKDSFHHLLVIKKREGDKIEVFNSKGQFLEASISLINKKTCEILQISMKIRNVLQTSEEFTDFLQNFARFLLIF